MKKILLITIVCVVAGAVSAQTRQGISFSNITTKVTPEEVKLDLDIQAQDLIIRCSGKLTLEFAVENATQRMALPVVIYASRSQARYEERRELLSEKHTAETFYTFDKVKRHDSYNLHYRFNIPYQGWMSQAALTFREYTHDCAGDRLTATATLTGNFGPAISTQKTQTPKIIYVDRPVYFQTPAPVAPPTPVVSEEEPDCDCDPVENQNLWRVRRSAWQRVNR